MKAKVIIGSLLGPIIIGMVAFEAVAQRAENDDMYFNSKDREKLKSEKPNTPQVSANDKIDGDYNSFRKKQFDKNEPETESVNETANPTDSYSARNINPEYISRSNSAQASEDESYYVEGYVPANTYDSYSASGNNNNWNTNNGYYGNYGYSSPYNYGYGSPYCNSYNSMYSPYYGSYSPWTSPYYGSGLGLSLGYMWGSPGWNYGMSYGWGNSYYNPYSYYPSYYSPYYYGNNYGYGGYGYPTYYYGSSDAAQPNYGKRPSRHSAIVAPTPRSYERVPSTATTSSNSGGRTRQTVDEYYVKPFKRTSSVDSYINSSTGGSRYVSPSSDYSGSRTRDSRDRSSSSPSFSTPARSSSPSMSMPTRSSSGGGGGSSPAPRRRD